MDEFVVACHDVDATERLGTHLGEGVGDRLVMGLSGPLGAGKTAFTRGVVFGIDPELGHWVSSPTYSVVNGYPTDPEVNHLDLYRLETVDDLESVGFWELLEEGILLIEWPERLPEVDRTLDLLITLTPQPDRATRVITMQARTAAGERVLEYLRPAYAAP